MTDGQSEDISKIFERPPHAEEPDFHGGILGMPVDCTLQGKIPLDEDYVEAFDFLEKLGKSLGYIKPETDVRGDSKSYIRKTVDDYCKTYLN